MHNASKTILVVEDERFLSKVYKIKLEKEGYNVIVALNGEEGLEQARAEKPDIILLDIMMPKKSGLEVLEELKNDPELKETPVIILTNLSEEQDMTRALNGGAVDYIVKANVPIDDVLEKIAQHA